jgi:hypothetical protein
MSVMILRNPWPYFLFAFTKESIFLGKSPHLSCFAPNEAVRKASPENDQLAGCSACAFHRHLYLTIANLSYVFLFGSVDLCLLMQIHKMNIAPVRKIEPRSCQRADCSVSTCVRRIPKCGTCSAIVGCVDPLMSSFDENWPQGTVHLQSSVRFVRM